MYPQQETTHETSHKSFPQIPSHLRSGDTDLTQHILIRQPTLSCTVTVTVVAGDQLISPSCTTAKASQHDADLRVSDRIRSSDPSPEHISHNASLDTQLGISCPESIHPDSGSPSTDIWMAPPHPSDTYPFDFPSPTRKHSTLC